MSALNIYQVLTVGYVATVIGMVLLTMSRADNPTSGTLTPSAGTILVRVHTA